MKKLLGFLFSIGLVGIFSACMSLESNSQAALLGMIYDKDRQPVGGAQIVVTTRTNAIFKAETDINGRFSIPVVPFGQISIAISQAHYEPFSYSFLFSTEAQVFYGQISSFRQLIDVANQAFEDRDWVQAWNICERVLTWSPEHPEALFLRAHGWIQKNEYEKARLVLEDLVLRLNRPYAAYLLLADLYEFKLNNKEKAVISLQQSLRYHSDPAIEERIAALKKE